MALVPKALTNRSYLTRLISVSTAHEHRRFKTTWFRNGAANRFEFQSINRRDNVFPMGIIYLNFYIYQIDPDREAFRTYSFTHALASRG